MYKPPDLLDQISKAAREQALEDEKRHDPRWDRLAAGRLSAEENDELLGLADASGEAHQAYQAFKPLGPAFEKRIAAAILARQQAEAEERRAAAAAAAAAGAATPARPTPPVGRPARLFGSAGLVLATLLAAIAVFHESQIPVFNLADLPGYDKTRGGIGDPGDEKPPAYANGDPLELVAEATVETRGKLEARLFVARDGEPLRQIAILPTIAKDGAEVRFSATLGQQLVLPLGSSNLVVVIARPDEFPDQETIWKAVRSRGQPDKYWQVLVQQIELEALP